MPMATTQEVGLYPATHRECAWKLRSSTVTSGLFAPSHVWRKGCRSTGCPTLQHALPAVGKSSHQIGMLTLRGLSWYLLFCPGDLPLVPAPS